MKQIQYFDQINIFHVGLFRNLMNSGHTWRSTNGREFDMVGPLCIGLLEHAVGNVSCSAGKFLTQFVCEPRVMGMDN